MGELVEDRVYDDRTGADVLYLATGTGIARVAVANGRVGRFSLVERCDARAVAADRLTGLAVAATTEDVLLHSQEEADGASGTADDWTPAEFGPAESVGVDRTAGGEAVLAADPDAHVVSRLLHPRDEPTEWLTVADVDAQVRAIDGPYLAAGDGCYRASPDSIADVGLTDVRDVATVDSDANENRSDQRVGVKALAAAAEGLYRLAGGWERVLESAFQAVAADAHRAIAVGDNGVVETDDSADDEWRAVDVPHPPIDVAVGERAYAVTEDGTVLAREDDGWRSRALGLPDVWGLCVGRATLEN